MHTLLRPARAERVDVIFLQEMQVSTVKAEEKIRRCASCFGYDSYVSRAPPGAYGKTGVAVLVRRASTHVTITGDMSAPIPGRLILVPATVCGVDTRLASVYVPVSPAQRKLFAANTFLQESDIVQGDWNSVPDVELDTLRVDKDPRVYANSNGKDINLMLARAGLSDIAQTLYNPEDVVPAHPGYTRFGSSVFTRLDRFYANTAHLTWISAGTSLARYPTQLSDHLPVVAEIAAPEPDKAGIHSARINPAVYSDPEVRRITANLWRLAYHDSSLSEGDKWSKAKLSVQAYLLEASKPTYHNTDAGETYGKIQHHYLKGSGTGPTSEWHRKLEELNTQLKRNKIEAARSCRSTYERQLSKEKQSKSFYKPFKSPITNTNIPFMHVTPDWDNPDVRLNDDVTAPEAILEQFTKYYKWLFKPKPSVDPKRHLDLLRATKIPEHINSALDAPLNKNELIRAIRSMAKGKSAGPDGLGSEFYHNFEGMIVDNLLAMLTEAEEEGHLHPDVQNGDISVLHKKGDHGECRNYRPITLLNVDYKIYAKVIAFRMRKALDYFVSPNQLGFVPGRNISEASHLSQLVQGYLDETDGEGLLIALDWEKAFDRVSWDFLHDAYEALGFGHTFRNRAFMLANSYTPPTRCVKIAGVRGEPFEIHSGVPQGCPFAPLAFLVCAEALTRAIKTNPDIEGIEIGDVIHVIGQFADDTILYLKNYSSLKFMWGEIESYEKASGHRANKKKFEGIRAGCTRRMAPPSDRQNALIKWAGKGYVRLLGIPHWEDNRDPRNLTHDTSEFWDELYLKCKRLLAGWKRHGDLTIYGRVMLVNMMIYSRFRYPCHCMFMPEKYVAAMLSDGQALLWDRDFAPDKDEFGSTRTKKRWIKEGAMSGKTRTHLGISLLDWRAHLKGLAVRWIMHYLDSKRGAWKTVLDMWFVKEPYTEGGRYSPPFP